MKTITSILTAAAIIILVLVLPAQAGSPPETSEPRLITVTGDAEVRVVPDEVILTLGVETWDEDLATAKKRNDARVKKVLAAAEKHGVEARHIKTDYISIEPRYHDNYEKGEFIGYFVRKTIVITLRDISKFEDLLTDALLDAGANYVHGVRFRTTELRKHRDQARVLAIKAAKEKAEALSKELGQKVGKPHAIREEYAGWWSWYNAWWGSRWSGGMAQNVIQDVGEIPSAAEGNISPGQIAVSAKVTVSFELE
jgi:uncharacterized protein YggE